MGNKFQVAVRDIEQFFRQLSAAEGRVSTFYFLGKAALLEPLKSISVCGFTTGQHYRLYADIRPVFIGIIQFQLAPPRLLSKRFKTQKFDRSVLVLDGGGKGEIVVESTVFGWLQVSTGHFGDSFLAPKTLTTFEQFKKDVTKFSDVVEATVNGIYEDRCSQAPAGTFYLEPILAPDEAEEETAVARQESRNVLKNSVEIEKPDMSFDDVGGQDEAKAEIAKLSSAINNPERYQRWGTRPVRGVCLHGPPGNGKTLLARALAAKINMPFHVVDASELVDMWYGQAEKNIDSAFARVRKTGGVLFIDEADSLASSRSRQDAHEVTKRMVNTLCRNMDGFNSSDKVVIFFATNRLEDMDKAVMRPGRVDRIVKVDVPDRNGRRQIFDIHIKKAEKIAERSLFEKLDIDLLIDKTDKYSGADIAEIVRRTLEAKVVEEESGASPSPVTMQDLLREISSYERNEKAKRKIGFH